VSYGIYLIHYPVANLARFWAGSRFADTWMRTGVIAVTSIGATLGIATISWLTFERPILRLKKRFYESGKDTLRVDAETLDARVPS
jgi:peptidoglycan/LPS O-acetylase OafA/YrhL